MEQRHWARLIVRTMGLVLIIVNARGVLWICTLAFAHFLDAIGAASAPSEPWADSYAGWDSVMHLPPIAGFLFGFYLFFNGRAVISQLAPSPKALCPRCGYELRGLPDSAARCPECGETIPANDAAQAGDGPAAADAQPSRDVP